MIGCRHCGADLLDQLGLSLEAQPGQPLTTTPADQADQDKDLP